MAMELVNGIPCFNCSDVARAQKAGITGQQPSDPLNPSDRISVQSDGNGTDGTDSVNGTSSGTAVVDGTAGTPAVSGVGATSDQLGVNQPLSSGDRGTVLNIAV